MKRLLKYSLILVILLSACKHYYHPVKTDASHAELKAIKNDSLSTLLISVYKTPIDARMNEVIAFNDSVLTREGSESTLANFILQAVDYYAKTNLTGETNSVAVVNRGGLRANLPKGEITVRNIFELMPFDNAIVILTIKGDQLKEAANSFCDNGKLFSNSLSFYCDKKNAINLKFRNENWSETTNYSIVTTDYLANGGDNCTFFLNPVKSQVTGAKLRDVIIDYCRYLTKNNKHILPYKDGRITVSK